ncbi:MAG TPA: hypothetical protein VGC68_04450, partial [Enterovirga sp.]
SRWAEQAAGEAPDSRDRAKHDRPRSESASKVERRSDEFEGHAAEGPERCTVEEQYAGAHQEHHARERLDSEPENGAHRPEQDSVVGTQDLRRAE